MSAGSLGGTGWCFGADGADDLGAALGSFRGSLGARPRLLGLGEPMHGGEEFPRLRNQVFRRLVENEGYRSVAIESDCLTALTVDAYVGPMQKRNQLAVRGTLSASAKSPAPFAPRPAPAPRS